MTAVGAGVMEIRAHAGAEYRLFYVAKLRRGIYVLHAFEKKTQKTPATEIALGRKRYQELLKEEAR